MLVNLTEVFTTAGKVEEKTFPIEMEEFQCAAGAYPLLEKTPLTLTMSNLGVGKALVKGRAEVLLGMACDRCLKEVPVKVMLDFERNFVSAEGKAPDEDEENQDVQDGSQLDIEALVNSEILMNLPDKVLCRPDCKGICKQCGQNLNEGECGCDDFVPDPRMAAIRDIFNAEREV